MRPSLDYTMLIIANALAEQSTCIKRSVGCVFTDKRGRILSTGFNGVASGMPHCNESATKWTDYKQLGNDPAVTSPTKSHIIYPHACNDGAPILSGADLCEAVHAESNALIQCSDSQRIHTCYTVWSPCFRCVKELLNTGCQRIVFEKDTAEQLQAKRIWIKAGRLWLIQPMAQPQHAARSA